MRCALVALLAAPAMVLAGPAAAADEIDRRVPDGRIAESSGLAVSPQHDGVLWTHNDSGNAPLLFALDRRGRVAATLRVSGTPDVDWEGMAAFRDATGRALLAVGDVGDNGAVRRRIEVDVVAEPSRLGGATGASPLLRLRLTYPDGPADAEALLVDTTRRRMFVVTKGFFGGDAYLVPASAWDGTAPDRPAVRTARLVRVGRVPMGLVTDGTVAPGGTVLLRSYTGVAAFAPFPLEPGDGTLATAASTGVPGQRQGEGLALSADGGALLLSSEGAGEPVLRVAVPASFGELLPASAPSPRPGPSPGPGTAEPRTPAASPSPRAAPAPSGGADQGLPWGAVAVAAGIVALLAAGVVRSRR